MAEDHADHHVLRCWTSRQYFQNRFAQPDFVLTSSGGDKQSVVWVEHVLGTRALSLMVSLVLHRLLSNVSGSFRSDSQSTHLVPLSNAIVSLVQSLPCWHVVLAVKAGEGWESGRIS